MNEQWQELKETIIEMRDNDGIGTQQEVCKFLANLMDVLEKQQPCEDCISREAVIRLVEQYPNIIGSRCNGLIADIKHLPSVTPSIPDVENNFDIGYNCGYADAMCDIGGES